MARTELVPNTDENASKCQCPDCPIYNKCMEDHYEHLFCSRGISTCDFKKTGCNCPTCPVWVKYELISLFFCEKGSENDLVR
jgi:hypothetical protein